MSPDQFRQLALSLPETTEGAHHGTTDFRVGGKIFATLGNPDPDWCMVSVTPEEQALLLEAEPDVFTPAPGAWGRSGSTCARLDRLDTATATSALAMAWRKRAPSRMGR